MAKRPGQPSMRVQDAIDNISKQVLSLEATHAQDMAEMRHLLEERSSSNGNTLKLFSDINDFINIKIEDLEERLAKRREDDRQTKLGEAVNDATHANSERDRKLVDMMHEHINELVHTKLVCDLREQLEKHSGKLEVCASRIDAVSLKVEELCRRSAHDPEVKDCALRIDAVSLKVEELCRGQVHHREVGDFHHQLKMHLGEAEHYCSQVDTVSTKLEELWRGSAMNPEASGQTPLGLGVAKSPSGLGVEQTNTQEKELCCRPTLDPEASGQPSLGLVVAQCQGDIGHDVVRTSAQERKKVSDACVMG